MTGRQPPTGPAGQADARALLALLIIAAVVTLLLLTGLGGKWNSTGRPDVTIDELPRAAKAGLNEAAATPSAGRGGTFGRVLGDGLVLVPHRIENRVAGYEIAAETPAGILAQAKLRSGDQLIEVDGRPLDAARLQTFGNELSALDAIEITYLRAGRMRKRTIPLSR